MGEEAGQLKLYDMHREFIAVLDRMEARDIVRQGYGGFLHGGRNTERRIVGVLLKVPLSVVTGNPSPQRALSISNFLGTRFLFRQKIESERANFFSFRHKNLDPMESPDMALSRMVENVPMRFQRSPTCLPPIRDDRGFSATSAGSRRSPARSAGERRPSTSQSKQPTSEIAA